MHPSQVNLHEWRLYHLNHIKCGKYDTTQNQGYDLSIHGVKYDTSNFN